MKSLLKLKHRICLKGVFEVKRIIAFLISLSVALSSFSITVGETSFDEFDLSIIDKLHSLNLIDAVYESDDFELNKYVTRAEAVKIIVRFLGIEKSDEISSFSDSDLSKEYESYIAMAQDFGIVDGYSEGSFGYYENLICQDAIKMIVTMLGYKPVALSNGGYPSGYLSIAYKNDLLEGTKCDINGKITYYDLFKMLDNALEVNIMEESYGTDVSYTVSKVDNILTKYHNLEILEGNISLDDKENRTVFLTQNSTRKRYILCDEIKPSDVIDEEVTVYYDTISEKIIFIEYDKSIEVFYDYISEINGKTVGKYFSSSVNTIFLKNENDEFRTNDLKIYYNDEIMTGANNLVDCYAKVIVKNNKVSRLYVYPLNEGGIIFHSDPSMIKYASGEHTDIVIAGLEDEVVTVIIDGEVAEGLYSLETDMVFDYWYNEKNSEYMFVASSRRIKGTLTARAEKNGMIYINDVPYEYGDVYPMYLSKNVNNYTKTNKLSDFLDKPVEAAIDDNMQVRYLRISPNYIEEKVFDGIVVDASAKDSGLGNSRKLKIFHMDATTGEQIYEVDEDLKNSPVSFEAAANHAADYSGHGVFRFTVNSNNVIKKIEHIPYYGYTHTKSTEFTESAYTYIDGILYSNVKTYALVKVDGKFTVRVLNFISDLIKTKPMSGSIKLISDYDIKYNPIPSVVVITGDTDQLYTSFDSYGIVTSVRYLPDEKVKYIMSNGSSLTVSADFHRTSRIVEPSFICYRTKGIGKDKYQLISVYNLNGGTDSWKTDKFTNDAISGFFKADGVAFHNMSAAQFIVDGEETDVYPFYNHAITVYEVRDTSDGVEFLSPPTNISPLGETNEFTEAWFYVTNWPGMRTVRIIIYKK